MVWVLSITEYARLPSSAYHTSGRQYSSVAPFPENSHDISGRTSFETCVNYIAGELDGAATTLERLGFNTLEEEDTASLNSVETWPGT